MFTGLAFLTPAPEDEKDDSTSSRQSRANSYMGTLVFDEIEMAKDVPNFRQPAPSLMGVGDMGEEWFGKER